MKNKKIAIVGMSYRLPGGSSMDFWKKLSSGDDLVTEVEEGRWAKKKFFHPRKSEPGSSYTFAAGSLSHVLNFDAAFFGISPREAAQMDPQQRLLMHMAWEALEDAGLPASKLKGSKCGVFIGISSFDYAHRLADDVAAIDSKTPTGNAGSIAANRISYFLDARGPSMPIDTACSSSLVAFHQAWNSLLIGDCDSAIVGGISLHFHPLGFISFTKTGMLSKDGRCRTFDASADGYVRSEGGGVVILKPLEKAIRDGDRILAVVEGSGINCDGKTNGITVPSGVAQAALLEEVYGKFNIDPNALDFLEAHGTGTSVGDPIEAWAIGNVLGKRRGQPLPMGSVKSNLGHLEAASGMAGLVKVLLMFRHRAIPPNLHFNQPNPRIDFDDLNLRVVTQLTPLPAKAGLCAGINSFGFGGANAHLILSSHSLPSKVAKKVRAPREPLPFILSAKSANALLESARLLAEFVELNPEVPLYDTAHALGTRRERLPMRALCLAKDRESLVSELRSFAVGGNSSVITAAAHPASQRPVFVFTGNGGHWPAMGQDLFVANPIFRRAIEEVDFIFADYAPFRLLPHFLGSEPLDLSRTEIVQPLIFAIQVGLVRILEGFGIKPSGVIGHSLGEVAAAWAAGSLKLEQAIQIIRLRSKCQQSAFGAGGMAAISAPRSEVEVILADPALDGIDLVVSGENSLRSTTVSGSREGLASLESLLSARNIGFKILDLPYPFHSPAMDAVLETFSDELGVIQASQPQVPMHSTVTGRPLEEAPNANYWAKNIREPVLFRDAVQSAIKDGSRIFVEIGPQPVLCNHILNILQSSRIDGHASGMLSKDKAGGADTAEVAWKLILGGVVYDWGLHFSRKPHGWAELPNYPWQSEVFALPASSEGGGLVGNDKEHPLLGYRAHAKDWEWENHLDTTGMAWLGDHKVGGAVVFPAAGFVEMALAAGSLRHPNQPIQLEDFEIRTPIILDARHSKTIRLILDENSGHFSIKSRERLSVDPWQLHAVGRIAAHASQIEPSVPSPISSTALLSGDKIYATALKLGLEYGPAFQTVENASVSGNRIDAQLGLPQAGCATDFLVHPSQMDGAFHSLFALFQGRDQDSRQQAFLPVRMDRFVLAKPGERVASVRAILRGYNNRSLLADFHLLDSLGESIAWTTGWRFRATQLVRRSFDRSRVFGQLWIPQTRPSECSLLKGQGESLLNFLGEELDKLPDNSLFKRYPVEGDALLDALCASFALEAFRRLADSGNMVSLADCLAEGRVSQSMEDYFKRLVSILVQDGLATETAVGEWRLSSKNEIPPAKEIWQSLIADFPEKASRFALVGRVGLHLGEILDGSRRIESLLPKLAKLSSGSYYFSKSALKNESQDLLLKSLGQLCRKKKPVRILWVSGPQPADEQFPAPLLQEFPGLFSVLLPDTTEGQEVAERFAAYPSIGMAFGGVNSEVIQLLTNGCNGFDAIVMHSVLAEDACHLLCQNLLPGGLLLCCLPERSRMDDFLPMGETGGIFSTDTTPGNVSRYLKSVSRFPLSVAGLSGPSILIAERPVVETAAAIQKTPIRSLVIPLDADAEPLAGVLTEALSAYGSSHRELLPPSDSDAISLWEKLLVDYHPERLVFISSDSKDCIIPSAKALSHEICAISASLRAVSKVLPRCFINIATVGAFTGNNALNWLESSLWGFARVARNEFGEIRIRCIDLPNENQAGLATDLAAEISNEHAEDEVLLNASQRFVRRVAAEQHLPENKLKSGERLVLDFDSPGPFQNLEWKRRAAQMPGPGQVAIIPKAAGLNFRDVMYAMGLLPDEALEGGFAGQTLGMELSGVVAAVGPDVLDFKPSDEVIAFAPAAFSNWAITSTSAVIHKPSGISFSAAATIPAAFYTAYHALKELACLRVGERVLIHGAAGGVGIAAVQIARKLGAEVFATAGSDEKRDFVRLLGADHVFNSRSLDFGDSILRVTNGEGVDVILNSLAGDAVTKNLEILRPFGRLLELGKRDFYENTRIGLRPFRHNIRYFAVDADQVMALRPDMAANGFRELLELFHLRDLAPLPHIVFPASEAASAFRFMQHSSQTGKVVLDLTDIPATPPQRAKPSPEKLFKQNGTYLLTGGWSGFGLATARWLLAHGVRSFAILGRRGPVGEDAERFLAECQALGVNVLSDPCDVADQESLNAILAKIRREMPPLRAVFHAATVIDDALIANLDPAKAEKVMAPKVAGAAFLDMLTREDALDHFVLYSSATTFFGNPGQAAYVAANTALEELAAKRQRDGLPATCISWGPIGDTGYLSRHAQIKEALAARTGGQPLDSNDALSFLGIALADGASQIAWIDMDWGAMARFLPSAGSPRFSMLRHQQNGASSSEGNSTDLRRELDRMQPSELLLTLKKLLKDEIGSILRVAPDHLDENRPLMEAGMDSLMGVELMSALENSLGVSIPIVALSEGPTISRLAERLAHALRPPENIDETSENSDLAAQARLIVSQHAAESGNAELEELVAEMQNPKNK